MSRVEINAAGRQIVVDHDGELAHVADTAQRLWDHTDGQAPSPGPAVGFVTQQRYEPAPVATGAYRGRPRPHITGTTEGADRG